jgi:hypothetical protein
MSIPIIFDDAKINTVKLYAENNIVSKDEIMKIYENNSSIIGDRKEHCIFLDFGYKFVYSIEEIPTTDFKTIYKIKKLSGSCLRIGRYPSIETMQIMLAKLGMSKLEDCRVLVNSDNTVPNIEIHDIIDSY